MSDKPKALLQADRCDMLASIADAYDPDAYRDAAAELRRLHSVNAELLNALISFTKSNYVKKQHPKRYATAIAAIAKAEGQR
jgi:hypothetical protein